MDAVSNGLRSSPDKAPDCFLGVIGSEAAYRVFGMVGNTRKRFLLAVNDASFQDDQAKNVGETMSFEYMVKYVFLKKRH